MKSLARCATSLLASFLLVLPAVAAPQETRSTPAQTFEQARLAEESQRDFARALELYVAVTEDDAALKDLAAKAWLRCGRIHQRLGRAAEAKQAFEHAAALEGEAAQEAKRILSGDDDDAARVTARVTKLIEGLRKISPPGKDTSRNLQGIPDFVDLVWIGDAAVPFLATQLEFVARDDLEGGPILTMALIDIGTEKAAKALRQALTRTDPIYLRGVLVWLPDVKNLAAEPVRTELLALLRQPDPRIRRYALQHLKRVMTLEEILALTRAEDAEVRAQAIERVPALFFKDIAERLAGYPDPVLDTLDATLRDPSPLVRRAGCALFAMSPPPILANPRGRELFLDALGREELFEAEVGAWNDQAPNLWQALFVPPLPAAKLLAVARKLAPFPPYRQPMNRRQENLSTLIRKSWRLQEGHDHIEVEAWSREERPLLWEMLRLGLLEPLQGWIHKFADAGDAVAIAEALARNGTLNSCEAFFVRVAPALSRTDRERLFESFGAILAAEQARLAAAPDSPSGELSAVVRCVTALTAIGLEEADRRLVQLAQEVPQLQGYVMQELIKRESTAPVAAAVLADLLVMEGDRARGRETSLVNPRSQLVKLLADRRATELLPRLARAYELGIEPLEIPHSNQSLGGVQLALIIARGQSNEAPRFDPRYPREQFVPVFEACARGNTDAFWNDAWSVVYSLGASNAPDAYRDDLARVIGRHVADCIQPVTRNGVVKEYVARACAGWQEFVAAHLDDPELGDTILEALPSLPHDIALQLITNLKARMPTLSPNAAKNVVARLAASEEGDVVATLLAVRDHPDANVRFQFVFSLLGAWGDRAVELVLPLAKDADTSVRLAVATGLKRSFDHRAIPALIELLRDSDAKVRSAAKESLDQLQFYFDQRERWTRLLDGSGLDATNAAEALLKQAAATQPKATRLAAIASLGTLGVAESLPFLIQWMGEGDAEIATAATSAVDRINRREASKEAGTPAGGGSERKRGE